MDNFDVVVGSSDDADFGYDVAGLLHTVDDIDVDIDVLQYPHLHSHSGLSKAIG